MLSLGIFFPTLWVAVPLSLILYRQAGSGSSTRVLSEFHGNCRPLWWLLKSPFKAGDMRFLGVDPGPASQTSF